MEKLWFLLQLVFIICLVDGVVFHNNASPNNYFNESTVMIQKVSLTQKGYIQFLRYITEVPDLKDYTFCIWMNSLNLTFNHPLLSYSKHEEERLIRMWISPHGIYANLEILNIPIFRVPVNLKENHWYHICQSWSSSLAAWNLYINGKSKAYGVREKMRNVVIKGGGDIVVGQEYTDFDKGLEDGIEGHIFGFNFVLSSTFLPHRTAIKSLAIPIRRYYPIETDYTSEPVSIFLHPNDDASKQYLSEVQKIPRIDSAKLFWHGIKIDSDKEIPSVLSYFNNIPPSNTRQNRGLWNEMLNSLFNIFTPDSSGFNSHRNIIPHVKTYEFPPKNSRVLNNVYDETFQKTLGLKLVELSYNCAFRRGAPLTGKYVLISWTKTPVRVFGGAILKNIPQFCI